jgi:hypothetical protein
MDIKPIDSPLSIDPSSGDLSGLPDSDAADLKGLGHLASESTLNQITKAGTFGGGDPANLTQAATISPSMSASMQAHAQSETAGQDTTTSEPAHQKAEFLSHLQNMIKVDMQTTPKASNDIASRRDLREIKNALDKQK